MTDDRATLLARIAELEAELTRARAVVARVNERWLDASLQENDAVRWAARWKAAAKRYRHRLLFHMAMACASFVDDGGQPCGTCRVCRARAALAATKEPRHDNSSQSARGFGDDDESDPDGWAEDE